MVTKVYPSIERTVNFMCQMRNDDSNENYIVVSSKGFIVGYGRQILS